MVPDGTPRLRAVLVFYRHARTYMLELVYMAFHRMVGRIYLCKTAAIVDVVAATCHPFPSRTPIFWPNTPPPQNTYLALDLGFRGVLGFSVFRYFRVGNCSRDCLVRGRGKGVTFIARTKNRHKEWIQLAIVTIWQCGSLYLCLHTV